MKKIILILVTSVITVNAGYYEICKADRRRLIHEGNNKNDTIRKLNQRIRDYSKRIQHETKINNKLRNEIQELKNNKYKKTRKQRNYQENIRINSKTTLKREMQRAMKEMD